MLSCFFVFVFSTGSHLTASAQDLDQAPDIKNYWHLAGPDEGSQGVNAIKLGAELTKTLSSSKREKLGKIMIAVIDSGTNINHDAIKDYIFTNKKEIPNNNIDDDNNGYVDDLHGWNFVGTRRDGTFIDKDSLEIAREAHQCTVFLKNPSKHKFTNEANIITYCKDLLKNFDYQNKDLDEVLKKVRKVDEGIASVKKTIREEIGEPALEKDPKLLGKVLKEQFANGLNQDPRFKQHYDTYLYSPEAWLPLKRLEEYRKARGSSLLAKKTFGYTVGKKYGYGSNNVAGPDDSHGTATSGLTVQMFEQVYGKPTAKNILTILPITAVPKGDGDERDIDVANAIEYAIAMGANIINMSFGKDVGSILSGKLLVDRALAKAEQKGIMVFHSAGNDGLELTLKNNFPNKLNSISGEQFSNFVEVGNSTNESVFENNNIPQRMKGLGAYKSNHGQLVDFFAPGKNILVAGFDPQGKEKSRVFKHPKEGVKPDNINNYAYRYSKGGTSLSAPIAAATYGITLSLSEVFSSSELTPIEIKNLLLQSVRDDLGGEQVAFWGRLYLPTYGYKYSRMTEGVDFEKSVIPFGEASAAGGIVDVYKAFLAFKE